ncbi:GNAT family N-acetyltransferase [Nostoc sp. LEGE 06077]|uniref:GNAT family N-acetyltransferase n=1 Tax=Nostoc sp. LEGE 06077 TaxID=915325 RepID=UPI0018807172|nr:GNAT family N-acetyltransferase [Nostoc sp. LEGE 06077]MBE9208563.1 GNAT family N-acetyltransferase [Nostoc sp. LEGE 06077]
MTNLKITVDDQPNAKDIRTVISHLVEYNNSQTQPDVNDPLAIWVRDIDSTIVAGLVGQTNWEWLYISHLWVSEKLRGQGYGSKMMLEAEKTAKQRGCGHVYLDTFSFQALGFYQHLGYQIFGVLEDFPVGHQRYFLSKKL